MQIDINDEDMDLIDRALVAFEEAARGGGLSGVLAAITALDGPPSPERMRAEICKVEEQIKTEAKVRRFQCAALRTKLMQAQASAVIKAASGG